MSFLCLCFPSPAEEYYPTYQPPDQPRHQTVSPPAANICFTTLILKLTHSRCNHFILSWHSSRWHFVLKCHISDLEQRQGDSWWEMLCFQQVCVFGRREFAPSSFQNVDLTTLCSAFRGEVESRALLKQLAYIFNTFSCTKALSPVDIFTNCLLELRCYFCICHKVGSAIRSVLKLIWTLPVSDGRSLLRN